MERQDAPRGLHRGGRLAAAVGSRLPSTADLLRRPLGCERRAREEPAAAGAVPRVEAKFPCPRQQGHLVVLPEPVRGHARAEWTARAAGDARKLRSEGRAERAVYAQRAGRRGCALVCRARSRAVLRPHRRDGRAVRRPQGVRRDAVHQGDGGPERPLRLPRPPRRADGSHDRRGRALDLRAAAEAHRQAVGRCLPRGRLQPAGGGPVHPPVQTEDRGRAGTRTMNVRLRQALPLAVALLLMCAAPLVLTAMQSDALTAAAASTKEELLPPHTLDEIRHALLRLPLAAALGAMLAFRPKRRGTPPRQVAVIQTQIILAVMAAVVMLVVGSNLARAFGVVGAAGLVRYRAKIEDPKDAGVMLSTLAVGLACGVGQYVIAAFSAVFILVLLWVIESFEPEGKKLFELKIKMGEDTDERRKQFAAVLEKFHVDFALLSSSDEEVAYEVHVPLELDRDRITNAILKLDPKGHAAVEWAEKKPKTK